MGNEVRNFAQINDFSESAARGKNVKDLELCDLYFKGIEYER